MSDDMSNVGAASEMAAQADDVVLVYDGHFSSAEKDDEARRILLITDGLCFYYETCC